jgi:hypothetical protein
MHEIDDGTAYFIRAISYVSKMFMKLTTQKNSCLKMIVLGLVNTLDILSLLISFTKQINLFVLLIPLKVLISSEIYSLNYFKSVFDGKLK